MKRIWSLAVLALMVSSGSLRADSRPAAAGACAANSTTLCLQDGRFSLSVTWKNQHVSPATTGVGTPVVDSDQTGFFWFFSAQSIELVVKIVDGRAFNGRFWVFYGALSDVEYTITVTDTQTGAVKSYHNPPGNICGGADTSAFGDTLAATVEVAESLPASYVGSESASSSLPPDSPEALLPASCEPSGERLCLLGNRFRVQVAWIDQHPPGGSGSGEAIPATDQSGYFWFFNPDSVELVVKIIDGSAVNGKFWVFFGALSDVEYTITVTDTQTGTIRVYHNDPGNICGGADTFAFDSPGGVPLNPADLAGDWSGDWHNNSFDTEGPASMTVSVDTTAHTFSVTLTLGGNVFGGSTPPPPQTFSGSYTPGGSGTFTQDSPFFGHVTATIGADGSVTGSITDLPDPEISRVDFSGTINPTQVNISYTVSLSAGGGSANGTITMTKIEP